VSNDPDFIKYETVFNSDHDNSAGLGLGEDMGYVESNYGKFMWCPKPMTVRYIRLYSNGNTRGDQNHYTEVEVYGKDPKAKAKAKGPTTRPSGKKTPTPQPAAKPKVAKNVPLVVKYPKAVVR
jgi:hypothetical protein